MGSDLADYSTKNEFLIFDKQSIKIITVNNSIKF